MPRARPAVGGVRAMLLRERAEVKVEGLPRRYPELPWREDPLEPVDLPAPEPGGGQVLLRVEACGACYTDLDIVEGRVGCKLPLILGHQIVGRVVEAGPGAEGLVGARVGVAWIAWACGTCKFCGRGLENLCERFRATGCDVDGGYAEYAIAYADFVHPLPEGVEAERLAPLLCAGAVGYRALRLADPPDGGRLGLFGFGSSAHIVIQLARALRPSLEVYVFTRSAEHRRLALELGADWAGHPSEDPPAKLDCAIDFTPVGETVARAMELLDRGGRLVINAIRKQTPVVLDYARHMWEEREVRSVANVSREDVRGLIRLAARSPPRISVQRYRLEEANRALRDLKAARVVGSPVIVPT